MKLFDAYSNYYDALNEGKNYAAEAQFIAGICEKWGKRGSILDLGCGTAKHAACLVKQGYAVTGVERSATMLARAKRTRSELNEEEQRRLVLLAGDALTFRTHDVFDVVTALFHVVSYQTSNSDLNAFLSTASGHLESGGIFVFDCWYGPAVLRAMPEVRMKSAATAECEIIRLANPVVKTNENVVEVHYRILIRSVESGEWSEIAEQHNMRYMFLPELAILAELNGFEIVQTCEFLTGRPLGDDTWGACVVARRK